MISVAAAAKKLGISERRVRTLCGQERIPGAQLISGVWVLPDKPTVQEASRSRPGKVKMKKAR